MKKTKIFTLIFSLLLACLSLILLISAENDAVLMGDSDGNGSVDSRDVVLIRQYLANLNYSTGESSVEINDSADMNGNGKIDLSDCILLREYIANMDDESEMETEEAQPSHIWEEKYERDLDGHWQVCSVCGESSVHDEHTKSSDGYCTVCEPDLKATDGVKYGVNSDDGIAYVSGYEGNDTQIVIAKEYNGYPVTKISASAFYNTGIRSVYIPETVTIINQKAFQACMQLTSVSFGENSQLKSIGAYAFDYCLKLTSITIPENVSKIDNYAFRNSGIVSAAFENPNGWYYPSVVPGSGGKKNISASSLKNPTTAADLLVNDYNGQNWIRE